MSKRNLDSLMPLFWAGIIGFSVGMSLATILWAAHVYDEQPYVEKSRCTAGQVEVLVKEPDDVQRWYTTAATCDEEQAE